MANKQLLAQPAQTPDKRIIRPRFRLLGLRFLRFIYRHLHPDPTNPRPPVKVLVVFFLGIVTFILFQLLVLTGVLLMFYFVTPVIGAYEGIGDVRTVDFTGAFLRNLHRWSGYGLVLVGLLYLGGLLYLRLGRLARWVGWLLVTAVLSCFSGYLIPWDQLADWALTAGTNLSKKIPFIGPQVQFLLIGGYNIGQLQLLAFYGIHLLVLPLIIAGVMAAHFWQVRKNGLTSETR